SLVGVPMWLTNNDGEVDITFARGDGSTETITVKPDEPVNNDYFNLIFKINDAELFDSNSKNNKLFFVFNDYKVLTNQLHPSLSVYALNPEAKTIKISFKSNNGRLSNDLVYSLINTFFA